jgi:hypothetical protein
MIGNQRTTTNDALANVSDIEQRDGFANANVDAAPSAPVGCNPTPASGSDGGDGIAHSLLVRARSVDPRYRRSLFRV